MEAQINQAPGAIGLRKKITWKNYAVIVFLLIMGIGLRVAAPNSSLLVNGSTVLMLLCGVVIIYTILTRNK
jgi:hypothetical protein